MFETSRRQILLGGAAIVAVFATRPAHATLVRGVSLPVLVQRSQRIVILEALDAVCHYSEIGGRRSLVTDTRARIHQAWGEPTEGELTVRTLGGRLDGVGELVEGQPRFELGMPALTFLKLGRDGQAWWTTAMAQGHFPLSGAEETSRLSQSRGLPTLLDFESSAVRRLVGRQVSEARELVRQARQP